MSKIKNGGLDHMVLNPSNSSNLEQLVLKGLITISDCHCSWSCLEPSQGRASRISNYWRCVLYCPFVYTMFSSPIPSLPLHLFPPLFSDIPTSLPRPLIAFPSSCTPLNLARRFGDHCKLTQRARMTDAFWCFLGWKSLFPCSIKHTSAPVLRWRGLGRFRSL